jgi:hypothetical protein
MTKDDRPSEKKPDDVERITRRDRGRDDLKEKDLDTDKPPMPGWPSWKRPD